MSEVDTLEMVAQVDPISGEVIGRVERKKAHLEGIWHASIHLWILDREGDILFQQRSLKTKAFPGLWDISVAGHIDEGEDGMREVLEELGVAPQLDQIQKHGYLILEHNLPSFVNREHARMYLWKSELALSDFSFLDNSVQALASISKENFVAFIEGQAMMAPVLRGGRILEELVEGKDVVPQIPSYWSGVKTMLGFLE